PPPGKTGAPGLDPHPSGQSPPGRHRINNQVRPEAVDPLGVITPVRRWFATRRLARAVRQGVGLRERSWDLPPQGDARSAALVDEILDWAREAVAGMRR